MDQHEMDKLMNDIQDYLKDRRTQKPAIEPAVAADPIYEPGEGTFISAASRKRIPLIMRCTRYASYAVEVLTIALFTSGIIHPFESWPRTMMFLLGVLLFGIFAITTLLSYQVRIQLLMKIEDNTRAIAANKARIADALDKIHIE